MPTRVRGNKHNPSHPSPFTALMLIRCHLSFTPMFLAASTGDFCGLVIPWWLGACLFNYSERGFRNWAGESNPGTTQPNHNTLLREGPLRLFIIPTFSTAAGHPRSLHVACVTELVRVISIRVISNGFVGDCFVFSLGDPSFFLFFTRAWPLHFSFSLAEGEAASCARR